MYITGNRGTRRIVIRELDGERLEAPITVRFSATGTAKVKEGVGEMLADRYASITIKDTEEEQPSEQDTEEE